MGNKIMYRAISRVESAIIEEKIDGSCFAWNLDENGKLHFYSAEHELFKDKCEKEWIPFMEFIEDKWFNLSLKKENFEGSEKVKDILEGFFEPNILYCAEALINGVTKYFGEVSFNEIPVYDRLFLFDIKGKVGKFYKRVYVEKLAEIIDIKIVPLTTFEHKESQLNPNILREGLILRYEDIGGLFEGDGTRDVIKLKLVERKRGKPQKITMEIKEYKKGKNVEILKSLINEWETNDILEGN